MDRWIDGSIDLAFSRKAATATARSREIQGSDMARKTQAVHPSSGRQIGPKTTKNVKLVTN